MTREPLEYWEDWGQEGDEAEDTPFGYSFRSFISSIFSEQDPGCYPSCSDEYIRARGGIPVEIAFGSSQPRPAEERGHFEEAVFTFGHRWGESDFWTWNEPLGSF